MKKLLNLVYSSLLIIILFPTFFLLTGCGSDNKSESILSFTSEQEKMDFAMKSEKDRIEMMGIRAIEVYEKNKLNSGDTTAKLAEILYYHEDGSLRSHVKMYHQDTIITLFKWNQYSKPTSVFRFDNLGNFKDSIYYYYDQKGNLLEIDSNGITKRFINLYDKEGKLRQVVTTNDTEQKIEITENHWYDPDGSKFVQLNYRCSSTYASAKQTLYFDKSGKIIRIEMEKLGDRVDNAYNQYGFLVKSVYDSSGQKYQMEYNYDSDLKKVSEIKINANGELEYERTFKYSVNSVKK